MRRQLYRGGGIASIPRQGYGLGDIVKKVGKTVRKLIPNELADVAVKAAPFVAPFNPIAAGLMRGIGRYDQRGSLSDALKQGLLTYGGGQLARGIGGAKMQTGFNPMGGMEGMKYGLSNPMGAWGGPKTVAADVGTRASTMPSHLGETGFKLADTGPQSPLNKVLFGSKEGAPIFGKKGLIGAGGAFDMKGAIGKGLPAVFAGSTLASLAVQKAMGDVGGREPGESLTAFNKRRESTVANYLAYYYKRANKFRIPPEELEQKTAEFVKQNTQEYRAGGNQGGRVGLYGGGEAGIKSLDAGAPDITYEGNEGPKSPAVKEMEMAGMMDQISLDFEIEHGYDISLANPEFRENFIQQWKEENYYDRSRGPVIPSNEDPINPFAPKPTGPVLPDKQMAAQGGRIGYRFGPGPVMTQAGLPGIPRMAPDGIEFDMRENGGFQPLGAKEGKDDVNAKLAKNEFVFTADAVRGAGGGDIELGAQKMYDTMKNLERRVV
tara:strand:+ start:153 stop:1628 length:1476 start_codon:yes stop_codon:yes gene_type:complete